MLEINGLTRAYGSHNAIENVSLRVADGEMVSIVGPSGCGKSTLMRCIAGLLTPTTGRVVLNGTLAAASAVTLGAPQGGIAEAIRVTGAGSGPVACQWRRAA